MSRWPDQLNIDNYLLRSRVAEGRGDRIALRLDEAVVTYGEVDSAASDFAAALVAKGVRREDRVLIVMPDGLDYVAALFGTFRIGAVGVMVNPDLTADAMKAIIERSRARVSVVHESYSGAYGRAVEGAAWRPEEIVAMDREGLPASEVETVVTDGSDPALWLFSGGTTGAPKAVVQTHRSLANTTLLYGQKALGLTEDDITIAVPKLYFGYATGSNLFFPFSVGASSVLFAEKATPEAVVRRIERHRATILVTVPSAINQMLQHSNGADKVSSLRMATSAGEALPDTLYEQFVHRYGVELLDGLGTAEMWHIFISNTPGDVRPGTVGRVVPGFEIKACDDDGNEVGSGEVGRLWVRGESLGLGYWEDPDKTNEAFRGEWFASSDLVSIDPDGYVTHRGRADDAIKIKGKWFRPQEVESTLLDHPSVNECAVVAVSDAAGLSKPVAFVVTGHEVGEQELIDWVLERLEPYKHPRQVFIVDSLPKTHLGKTDRAALKRLAV